LDLQSFDGDVDGDGDGDGGEFGDVYTDMSGERAGIYVSARNLNL